MTRSITRKLMLRACPRCQGDLLFDSFEEDFACLQCGRHLSAATVATLLHQDIATDLGSGGAAHERTPALAA